MAFCKNCGKEIADNAFVCPSCGVRADSAYVSGSKKTPGKVTAGFVCSLSGLVFAGTGFLTFFMAIITLALGITGMILSRQGKTMIEQSNGQLGGLGLAKAGAILGIITIVFSALTLLLSLTLFAACMSLMY